MFLIDVANGNDISVILGPGTVAPALTSAAHECNAWLVIGGEGLGSRSVTVGFLDKPEGQGCAGSSECRCFQETTTADVYVKWFHKADWTLIGERRQRGNAMCPDSKNHTTAAVFSRRPISGISMRIMSPGCNVNSLGGMMPAPVKRTTPCGKRWQRQRWAIRSENGRFR